MAILLQHLLTHLKVNGGALNIRNASVYSFLTMAKNNIATQAGGAVYVEHGYDVQFNMSTFDGNVAQNGEGGGVFADSTVLFFTNAGLKGNTASLNGVLVEWRPYLSSYSF